MTHKTAVILYGYCRTYKTTAPSLIKNILEPNNADLFVSTYDNTGVSILSKNEDINRTKFILGNKQDLEGEAVSTESLSAAYGKYLKDAKINKYNPQKFVKDSEGIFSPILKIERIYSLYWNITNAMSFFLDYVKKNKLTYDAVILARPDLFFFEKLDLSKMDLSKVHVPTYGGNLIKKMEKPEPYYVAYYENIELGEYIPFRSVIFSDQLIISSFDNMKELASLYENLAHYDKISLPVCHSETVLYYHLVYKQKKEYTNYTILYEILRENYVQTTNEFKEVFADKLTSGEKQGEPPSVKSIKSQKCKEKMKDDVIVLKKSLAASFKLPLHALKYLRYKISNR